MNRAETEWKSPLKHEICGLPDLEAAFAGGQNLAGIQMALRIEQRLETLDHLE